MIVLHFLKFLSKFRYDLLEGEFEVHMSNGGATGSTFVFVCKAEFSEREWERVKWMIEG